MATNFLNWSWPTQHVQTEVTNSEYLSGEHTLLMAGPPRLSQLKAGNNGAAAATLQQIDDGSNALFPIGLMANFRMSQDRNLRSIFEIGSARRYIVPEKLISSVQMARIKYFGPSLLRVLYAYYPTARLNFATGKFAAAIDQNDSNAGILQNLPEISGADAPGYGDPNADVVGANFGAATDNPQNNRDFWINMASTIFRQPLGLGLYFKASNNRGYGAIYLEEMLLGNHALNIDAEAIIMMETVAGAFDRIMPIQLNQPVGFTAVAA